MNCQQAQTILAQPNHPATEEARQHTAVCPVCQARLEQLADAILSNVPDEISCAECRDRLPDYLTAQNSATGPLPVFASVADHLRRCRYCAEEYAALSEAMAAWASDTLPDLATTPAFDLSFLHPQPTPALWVKTATQQARTLFANIVVALENRVATFGAMPPPLTPRLVPARAWRSEDIPQHTRVLSLPDPDADLQIQISVGALNNETAVIGLQLTRIEPETPLADLRVMLYDAERRPLAGSMTASDGSVVFRDLTPGGYIIQIRTSDHRWELPVLIVTP